MPEKKKTKKQSKNKTQNLKQVQGKEKKVLPSNEVVSFSDLANKYQKKLDHLLGIESTVTEVDEVLDDYVEDVERLFVLDQDNQKHRFINLAKKKVASPYVLDLSKVKDSQAVDLEKAAKIYDQLEARKKDLRAKSKEIQSVKVIEAKKIKVKNKKGRIASVSNKAPKIPRAKSFRKKMSRENLDDQKIQFSYWRYWWFRNSRYLSFYVKGLFFLLLLMFSLVVFLLSNMRYINDALSYGEQAIYTLDNVKSDLLKQDWAVVEKKIAFSTRSFLLAQGKLQQVNPLMEWALHLSPYVGAKYRSIKNLLNGSVSLGLASMKLVAALDENFVKGSEVELSQQLDSFLGDLVPVRYLFKEANNYLQKIDVKYFPVAYGDNLLMVKNVLPKILEVNDSVLNYRGDILDLLGHEYPRRYLLLFQNNKEIRPTGGFMGSLAFVDVAGAAIEKVEVPGGGPYDYQGGLRDYLMAPVPLQLLNARWFLQDSNWFTDYPTSAKKTLWFLEKSGGPSADGVVSINFSVLEDIMSIVGPIRLPNYSLTLTANNLWIELQKEVEVNYDREENKPKAIISDLLFALEDRLLNGSASLKQQALQVLLSNLWQKNVLAYSKNEHVQGFLESYNLAGKIIDTDNDYLMLVNSNVGGSKTDAVIEQTIDHQLLIEEDGSLVATVEISRKHNGVPGNIFTGNPNINYMQLYVPEGSELLAAYGFEKPAAYNFKKTEDYYTVDEDLADLYADMRVDEFSKTNIHTEFGKTVFSNWTMTDVGGESVVTFMYRLPFNLKDLEKVDGYYRYDLYMQKQSGMENTKVSHSFVWPNDLQVKWSSPEILNNLYTYDLFSDNEFTLLLKD